MGAPNQRRLARVGIAVASLDEARKRFAYSLGAEIPEIIDSIDESDFTSASEWLRGEGRFCVFEIGSLQLVLIERAGSHSSGDDLMHHLSFETDDLDSAMQTLTSLGGTVVTEGKTEAQARFALLDGTDPLRCYIEMHEANRKRKSG